MADRPQTQTSSNQQSQPGDAAGDGGDAVDQVVDGGEGGGQVEGAGANTADNDDDGGGDRLHSAVTRYREKRARDAQAAIDAAEEAAAANAGEGGEEGDGDEGGPAPAAAAPKTRTIHVDGKAIEKTEDEWLALASKAATEDQRLAETRGLLADAALALKAAAETRPAAAAAKDVTPAEAEPAPEVKPKRDPEATRRQAEGLQVGDLDAGAAALQELKDEVREEILAQVKANAGTQSGKPLDDAEFSRRVSEGVESKLADIRATEGLAAAVAKFGEDNPEIIKRPRVHGALKDIAKEQMLQDWKASGATDEQIASWGNKTPEAVALLHHKMVAQKVPKLRSYDEILSVAAKEIKTEFNIGNAPAPGTTVGKSPSQSKVASQVSPPARMTVDPAEAQRRIDAKQAKLPQPKTAGGRGQITPTQRPRTALDFIADERKRRGYSVNR